jgi:2,4-dienoyl-CoA reductase-like NADH-dependent reductase (Old Yellow Enzyme family)
MKALFEKSRIRNLILENRFIRSATWEGMAARDGASTPELLDLMKTLALGGVGLIISSHAYVSLEGQAGRGQLGIYSDRLLPGLGDMVKAVHDAGGKIMAQLAHAGCQARPELTGLAPIGPSSLETLWRGPCTAMDEKEIRGIIDAFIKAAVRARTAGFDGVQIHAAHGYLLSQFLSPRFNERSDAYGGNQENRSRLVLEIIQGIRGETGPDYPVCIKINSEDFLEGGMTIDQMIHTVLLLEEAGLDAVELSGGTPFSGDLFPLRKEKTHTGGHEAFYLDAAEKYKTRCTVPLMLVGGIRSLETARDLVQSGTVDYISICRPLIREPDLIARWRKGDTRPSECLRDNACIKALHKGGSLHCPHLGGSSAQ